MGVIENQAAAVGDSTIRVVVVGNGMVGHRFVEDLRSLEEDFCSQQEQHKGAKSFHISVFCDERHAAYNRMLLTSYFEHKSVERLSLLAEPDYYTSPTVLESGRLTLYVEEGVTEINSQEKEVISNTGRRVSYDVLVLATGSSSFVPPITGLHQHARVSTKIEEVSRLKKGVFVYRTIQDIEDIITYGSLQGTKRAAVIGGGLLGLEAAKAAHDLGLEVTILDRGPHLMSRQLDAKGSSYLQEKIEALGLNVRLRANTAQVLGREQADAENGEEDLVTGLTLDDGTYIKTDMVIMCAGIRARDELARAAGLAVRGQGGGGILVNDYMETSMQGIYAIGECACHKGMTYGLVAPGYDMAKILAKNLIADFLQSPAASPESRPSFLCGSLSTKLKLLGVVVASFGDYFADKPGQVSAKVRSVVYEDPFEGIYKKLIFTADGKHLLGGILVGDAKEYTRLVSLVSISPSSPPPLLPVKPHELLGFVAGEGQGGTGGQGGVESMPDDTQVCSCNNVSKGDVSKAIREKKLTSIGDVKKCTRAGTGCGGCVPLVNDIFEAEMKALGQAVSKGICEHFVNYTRQELYTIIKVSGYKDFDTLIKGHGNKGLGCEICKPVAASIFASLWNEHVLKHQSIQDTNDRFLANIQRSGQYSVVPRVPGGEITPEKLMVLGAVAKKYGLYTKITGGQRVDLFGAPVQLLPEIWEELIDAGFESGHAYGKSLRTVKTCVGSSWCRYGVQDSVSFGILIENRYKGVRSPHKLKGGVSGCVRECAEAQSKDFGLIATEKGYNIYVCGNGGAKPKHAVLLAPDVPEELAIKYLDRFLAFYIMTADRLQRTAPWLDKLEGGIDFLRKVVIEDSLGIAEKLEEHMQYLISTYQCEWTEVVRNPEKRKLFKQFRNTETAEESIEFTSVRGQTRPVDWPKNKDARPPSPVSIRDIPPTSPSSSTTNSENGSVEEEESVNGMSWVRVGHVYDFPEEGGATVKVGDVQLAVFHLCSQKKWYATQNMCPHKNAFVLSNGIVGDTQGITKVSCPFHKKNFELETGSCMSGEDYKLQTFDVKVELDGGVHLLLPAQEQLDRALGTRHFIIRKGDSEKSSLSPSTSCSSSLDQEDVREVGGCSSGSTSGISCGGGNSKLDW